MLKAQQGIYIQYIQQGKGHLPVFTREKPHIRDVIIAKVAGIFLYADFPEILHFQVPDTRRRMN